MFHFIDMFHLNSTEVPIPLGPVFWKSIYRDNVLLGQNWESGNCAIVDVKGHTDK